MMPSLTAIRTEIGWRISPRRMIDQSYPKPDPGLEEVYLKRGIILIHIPKNAGTSVEDALYGYRIRHRTWKEISNACPCAWQSLPKIAILRDPVERFLSAFDYLKAGGRNETDRRVSARLIGTQPIDMFISRCSNSSSFQSLIMRYFHFRPQADYVCDGSIVMVDTLIPFPEMAKGLAIFAGVRSDLLTHSNKTSGARTQLADLSPKEIEQIRAIYSTDSELYAKICADWPATLAARADCTRHLEKV